MKKIDPIERALDAFFGLDDAQKRVFEMAVKHVGRFSTGAFPKYVGTTEEKPKRGRPVGSKNRKIALTEPASPLSPEGFDATALFAGNGAPTEGL